VAESGENAKPVTTTDPKVAASSYTILVRNTRAIPVTFVLEPWGETYPMPVGAGFEIRAVGPVGGTLEIHEADQQVVVYGWPGSTVSVLRDGVDVAGAAARSPVPMALPPGMSVSQFMSFIFGRRLA